MKVLIVGGGLIGVTAQCCGHEVTVLEREEGVGRETSFANGGLLTPSMSEPWNAPGRSGRVIAVLCDGERVMADRYIVAAGSYTATILERIGVSVPVRPAKGYSITLSGDGVPPLNMPVLDDELHAVVVPLGRDIRVAGTAELPAMTEEWIGRESGI
jgi:glycine/D-amino acid oxidase-like deaminating enzyme